MGISIDASGAFRCYNLNNIKSKDTLSQKMIVILFFGKVFLFYLKKYLIYEIPIELPYRSVGSSKMKFTDIIVIDLYFNISMKKSKY